MGDTTLFNILRAIARGSGALLRRLFFLLTLFCSSHSCRSTPYPAGEKRSEPDHWMYTIKSPSSPTSCTGVWLERQLCIIAWRSLASFLSLASSLFRTSAPAVALRGTCFLHTSAWLVPSPPQVLVQMLSSQGGLLYQSGRARLCYITSKCQIAGA